VSYVAKRRVEGDTQKQGRRCQQVETTGAKTNPVEGKKLESQLALTKESAAKSNFPTGTTGNGDLKRGEEKRYQEGSRRP